MWRPTVILIVLEIAGSASAAYVGVEVTAESYRPSIATFRIYAIFDDPSDQLLAAGAAAGVAALAFEAGSPLVNDSDPFPPLMANDFAAFPLTAIWDSYVTIGADQFVGNETTYTDGFLGSDGVTAVIVGSRWFAKSDATWFDEDPSTPETADAAGRVLMAQLSFAGPKPSFTLEGAVWWRPASGDAQAAPFFVAVPSPGAAIVMLGVWRGRRRR